jgi:ribosomal protein S18 acetylase RimI-like enzyme
MRCDTAGAASPEPPTGVSLVSLDIESDEDLRRWHATHMDAFSEHFGFVPRPFESFRDMVMEEPGLDRQGVFLAMRAGQPLGYLESSDELVDDGYGSISRLGVVKAARGQGIGELLLRHGIAHAASKGYSRVELSVDAGNESGALRLYEKVGFEVAMSWLQLSNNPDFGRVGES